MSERVRVALIGTGMMGLEHLNNLLLQPEVAVAGFADPTETSLTLAQMVLSQRHAALAPAFADHREMLAAVKPDAVIVSSPNHTHGNILSDLLATDIAVLCEKPLCHTLEEALRIAERAARRTALFWVGMEYRFMPPATRFIAQVHAGRIGRLQMLALREHRFPFLKKVGDWNRFSANTGGTMVEKCCHFFDLMRYIVRSEATQVYCSGAMDVNHHDERYDGRTPDIMDNSYTIVDFASGARAMLDLCMFAEGSADQEEIAAVGDIAKLECFVPSNRVVFSPRVPLGAPKKVETEVVDIDAAALAAGSHSGATYYQQRAFFAALASGAPAQVSALDGARAVAIGAAAERSAKERRSVALKELDPAFA
jgi:myo-inositol 2-dehydrogenase / D-chiro-inositol 1-dehydrogenase